MTLAMCCEIKFLKTETQEELSIYKVSAVTIEKSWKLYQIYFEFTGIFYIFEYA